MHLPQGPKDGCAMAFVHHAQQGEVARFGGLNGTAKRPRFKSGKRRRKKHGKTIKIMGKTSKSWEKHQNHGKNIKIMGKTSKKDRENIKTIKKTREKDGKREPTINRKRAHLMGITI